jgi:hypothetical protein
VTGSERLQAFEQHDPQSGRLIPFDLHGREIVPGEPAPSPQAGRLSAAAAQLLERLALEGEKMPPDMLRREAGLVLPKVPTTKPGTIAALQARLTLQTMTDTDKSCCRRRHPSATALWRRLGPAHPQPPSFQRSSRSSK